MSGPTVAPILTQTVGHAVELFHGETMAMTMHGSVRGVNHDAHRAWLTVAYPTGFLSIKYPRTMLWVDPWPVSVGCSVADHGIYHGYPRGFGP